MRVRHLVSDPKVLKSDTNWRTTDLQPKHAPIYAKTRPIRAGWEWRSAKAESGSRQYILVALCNPPRDNWQAMLIVETGNGASMVARLEYHGSHPGLHAHSHCDRSGIELGGASIDNLPRFPPAGHTHRRTAAWTKIQFWNAAREFFRIKEKLGDLGI